QRWQQYVTEFGEDEDMVVVVQGDDRAEMERALEHLAAEVAKQPQHFDRLFYKWDLRALSNRALLFLPTEQIKEIQDNIKDMTLLLAPLAVADLLTPAGLNPVDPLLGWHHLSLQQLLNEAETRLRRLRDRGTFTAKDQQFFRQLDAICKTAAATLAD